MEEFLKLTDDIFNQYESMERKTLRTYEQLQKSMDDFYEETMKDLASEKTPKQNKKKAKRLPVICDEEESISSEQDDIKTQRPVRSARLKAKKTMKEPSIKGKIRRPVVKLERISNEILNKENNINLSNDTPKPATEAKHSKDELVTRHTDIASETNNLNKTQTVERVTVEPVQVSKQSDIHKRQDKGKSILNKESVGSVASHSDKDEEISNKNLDESVVILPPVSIKVEILSDGESDKMPPPAIPEPKVKRTKKKKTSTVTEVKAPTSFRNTRSRIKREQIEEQNSVTSTDNTTKEAEQTKVVVEEANKSIANSTSESVYEDANNDGNNLKPVVVLERCNVQLLSDKQDAAKLDATFISPQPPIAASNASSNDTFVVPLNAEAENQVSKCDETFFVAASPNVANETITISTNVDADAKHSINNATYGSIMTEDASDEEIMEVLPPPTKLTNTLSKATTTNATFIKPKNELFSPFMQSPIKKKIEAFEQVVADSAQRQTRTRAAAKASVAKQEPSSIPRQIKALTPNIEAKIYRSNTPMQQDEKATSSGLYGKKFISNSTSKLAHIQKSLQIQPKSASSIMQTKCISVNSLLSRENSVDDLRHGLPLQSIEEKRKKREEKQRLAQQLREAKEKERREQTEKLIREREEKVKKMLLEKEERARLEILKKKALKDQVEQRRQQEEINKNIRLQQQQREMMLKHRNEQMLEKELSEREYIDTKEMLRLNQEKEILKLTLAKNKEKAAKERLLKKSKIVKYDFDILGSDDSTDEEGKQTNKRPDPPAWSRSNVRQMAIEQQSYVSSKLIDSFFSIAPMSPDLREIFPAIDPKCLRRKSSAVWNTPPRYTLLPKY